MHLGQVLSELIYSNRKIFKWHSMSNRRMCGPGSSLCLYASFERAKPHCSTPQGTSNLQLNEMGPVLVLQLVGAYD